MAGTSIIDNLPNLLSQILILGEQGQFIFNDK